ncbi:hypothetical protein [Aequorivita antarctica]|uniref:Uncharacterized protein n=1 Tax=Aequorivita antarctica TaxID=153266 RepID=A0A5C6YYL7_9FLAO|nr:hypothetical protein [Aequorivita antarctica]TXD72814.1 hypothetical protein ESU54_11400 [Aequorivita antarctica]
MGYKLISSFFGKKEVDSISTTVVPKSVNFKTEKEEVFDLPTIFRDPFLGKYTIQKKEVSIKMPHRKVMKVRELIWPSIEYYGFLKGEKSNGSLLLFKINNKLERIRKGEKFEGLEIKEIYQDSVLIFFGNEKKIFVKK